MGIGNTLRSDDAAGVLVARGLAKSHLSLDRESPIIIEAGHAPENRTAELRRFRPDLVLLIDAAEMGESAGTIRWVDIDKLDGMSASTHTLPLSMLVNYLKLELHCEIALLGIQPASTNVGEKVCCEVSKAIKDVESSLLEWLS